MELYLWDKMGYNFRVRLTITKEVLMSYQIQDAITEYVDERVVESIKEEVESSIDESYIIQDIRSDVETLQARLDEEIVNEVVKQVITKLASTLDGYELVSNSTIDRLNQKVEELNKQLSEKKDVA